MADRKNVLVDPQVQWALGRRILMHWVSLLGCLLCVNVLFGVLTALEHLDFGRAVLAALGDQVTAVGVMLLLLPIFIRDTLRLSNRFAGPMYRLRTAMQALGQGQRVRPLKFRNDDFWQEVAGEFNRLATRFEQLEARNRFLEQQLRDKPSECEQPVSC